MRMVLPSGCNFIYAGLVLSQKDSAKIPPLLDSCGLWYNFGTTQHSSSRSEDWLHLNLASLVMDFFVDQSPWKQKIESAFSDLCFIHLALEEGWMKTEKRRRMPREVGEAAPRGRSPRCQRVAVEAARYQKKPPRVRFGAQLETDSRVRISEPCCWLPVQGLALLTDGTPELQKMQSSIHDRKYKEGSATILVCSALY